MHSEFRTLPDALQFRAGQAGGQSITFLEREHRDLGIAGLRVRALRRLGALQAAGLASGDELILLLDDNEAFLEIFWAAQFGGIVPAPVAVGMNSEHRHKLFRIFSELAKPWVCTDAQTAERYRVFAEEQGLQDLWPSISARLLTVELLEGTEGKPSRVSPEQPALIQFSSGSTGAPKGVVLSHENLLTNIAGIFEAAKLKPAEKTFSWMPLTHDLGLIGFHLTPMITGMNQCLMPSDLFARRPLLWLEKAAELKANILCSPNFGYRHWLKAAQEKMLDLDLSAVRLIFNGAEPISADLAREFLARLAPCGLVSGTMFPVYGLAEASLAVSFPPPGSGISTIRRSREQLAPGAALEAEFVDAQASVECVCLGKSVPRCEFRIADETGRTLDEGVVGRILIRGRNVTRGYYGRDGLIRDAIDAEGWFDTGDLGFSGPGGLYVSGRVKDVLFVNGRNFYLHDVEEVAAACAGLAPGKVIACAIREAGAESDQALLFVLHRGSIEEFAPQAGNLKDQIGARLGLTLAQVLPIRTIPKTTSGKLQRARVAEQFIAGEFDAAVQTLARLSAPKNETDSVSPIEADIKRICDSVLGDVHYSLDDSLFDVCTSSLALAQIHEGIEAKWPGKIDVTDLFDHPTIAKLARHLESRIS